MFAIYEWTPAKLTLVFTIYTTLFTFLQYGCPLIISYQLSTPGSSISTQSLLKWKAFIVPDGLFLDKRTLIFTSLGMLSGFGKHNLFAQYM